MESNVFIKKPSFSIKMGAASDECCLLGVRNDLQQRLGAYGASS